MTPSAPRERYVPRDAAFIAGNDVRVLVDGAEAYPAMLTAIAAAKHSILLESYIFADDATGRRFIDALVERARAGVLVRLLVDGVGSFPLPDALFAPFLAAGGRLAVYRPVRRLFFGLKKTLRTRNHRKILVVDDEVAFVGGLNIGDDYAPKELGGRGWHDLHACVRGPAAAELVRVTARTWEALTGERLAPRTSSPQGATDVLVIEARPLGTSKRSLRATYLRAIDAARSVIHITNAYFVPDRPTLRALRRARARGVVVQLLLAGTSDVRAVRYASRRLYKSLLRAGVEIYEWVGPVLHAKAAVVDGLFATVGSFNLSHRSILHNLEANIACTDEGVAAALDTVFARDLAQSRPVSLATWHRRPAWQKLLEVFFYQFRYFL